MEFKDRLHEAALKFDGRPGELRGHVTNGSLEAQVQVVRDYLEEFFKTLESELKAAGDLGKFDEEISNEAKVLVKKLYPEYVAIEVLKKAREKYVKL